MSRIRFCFGEKATRALYATVHWGDQRNVRSRTKTPLLARLFDRTRFGMFGMLAGAHRMPVRRDAGRLGIPGGHARRVRHVPVVKLRGRAVLTRRELVLDRRLAVLAALGLQKVGHTGTDATSGPVAALCPTPDA